MCRYQHACRCPGHHCCCASKSWHGLCLTAPQPRRSPASSFQAAIFRRLHYNRPRTLAVASCSGANVVPSQIQNVMITGKVQILPLRRVSAAKSSPNARSNSSSTSPSNGTSIAAKRTRASRSKVRTGCLTCKIRKVSRDACTSAVVH